MILPLLLALAGAGQAPAAPQGAQQDQATMLARAGMSPAGVAALRRLDPAARAQAEDLRTRLTPIEVEIRAAALANDVDRVARALEARDALVARFSAGRTATVVGLLRTLSPADRQVMMRSLAGQMR